MENRLILLLFACVFLCSCGQDGSEISKTQVQQSSDDGEINESSLSAESKTDPDISSEISESVSEEISEEISEEVPNKAPVESLYTTDDDEMVLITDYIPSIALDIRYAAENNFTKQRIYSSSDAYLRYGTVKKLLSVQAELNSLGYGLLIWDAYRPPEAQKRLWEICPDPSYVSDPSKGYSGHCRGNTVDLTLIDLNGKVIEMPSEFDEFGAKADRDYSDISDAAAENAILLESIMKKYGFSCYQKEWWHFSDTVKYDIYE